MKQRIHSNFVKVSFQSLDGYALCSPSYCFYFSSLFVLQGNGLLLVISTKDFQLVQKGYQYFKIRGAFSIFYHKHSELIG